MGRVTGQGKVTMILGEKARKRETQKVMEAVKETHACHGFNQASRWRRPGKNKVGWIPTQQPLPSLPTPTGVAVSGTWYTVLITRFPFLSLFPATFAIDVSMEPSSD